MPLSYFLDLSWPLEYEKSGLPFPYVYLSGVCIHFFIKEVHCLHLGVSIRAEFYHWHPEFLEKIRNWITIFYNTGHYTNEYEPAKCNPKYKFKTYLDAFFKFQIALNIVIRALEIYHCLSAFEMYSNNDKTDLIVTPCMILKLQNRLLLNRVNILRLS